MRKESGRIHLDMESHRPSLDAEKPSSGVS